MSLCYDHYYVMGKTHLFCQDYTCAGQTPVPFIIVSDGCSSSQGTDIGSRLLCLAARQLLKDLPLQNGISALLDYHSFGKTVINDAAQLAQTLQVSEEVLDATLLVAVAFEDIIQVYVYGDGVIALQSPDKQIAFIDVEFVHNTPFYLSYWLNNRDRAQYAALDGFPLRIHDSRMPQNTEFAFDTPLAFQFERKRYPCLALFSDGVKQYYHYQHKTTLGLSDVLTELLSFKQNTEDFVKRRLLRANQMWAQQEIVPSDDVAMAVLLTA